ncbi:hypothetical protein BGZ94_000180 [Podila epigama]|nr:hypothetical protein BGZ94_000180 [Podila epigama]
MCILIVFNLVAEYVTTIERLKAQLAEREQAARNKQDELGWCVAAKTYKQERNYIVFRLRELELEIGKMLTASQSRDTGTSHDEQNHQDQINHPPRQQDQQSPRQNFVHSSSSSLSELEHVGSMISELVDDMTPTAAGGEPQRPPLPYLRQQGLVDPNFPPSPNPVVKPSDCTCESIYQEEAKALRARSEYVENHISLLEVKYERAMQALQKFSQWKDALFRKQEQRRTRDASAHDRHSHTVSASPFPSPLPRTVPRHHHSHHQPESRQQTNDMRTTQVRFGLAKVASFNDDSDTSQKRREETLHNTMLNKGSTHRFHLSDIADVDSASTHSAYVGKGSQMEPHVLDDDVEGHSKEIEAYHQKFVVDEREEDQDVSNEEAVILSPTFPSELALSRRQGVAAPEWDDDSEGEEAAENPMESKSPSRRVSEARRQRLEGGRTSEQHSVSNLRHGTTDNLPPVHRSYTVDVQQTTATTLRYPDFSIPSDHSSPPMFDSNEVDDTEQDYGSIVFPPVRAPRLATTHEHGPQKATRETTQDNDADQPKDFEAELNPFMTTADRPENTPTTRARNSSSGKAATPRNEVQEAVRPIESEDAASAPDGPSNAPIGKTIASKSEKRVSLAHARQDLTVQKSTAEAKPVEHIYNYTERRKDKRKQMHASDCPCCQRFYEITGPLPLPDGYNAFFTPAPKPGQLEVWEETEREQLDRRIQTVSRHRVQHEVPLTPPGYWDTQFPPTPERREWDRIANERRHRKKQRVDFEATKEAREGGTSGTRDEAGVSSSR